MAYSQFLCVALLSCALISSATDCGSDPSCSSASPEEHAGNLLMQTKMNKDYVKGIRLLQNLGSKSLNANLVLSDVEELVKDYQGKGKDLPPEMKTAVENFRTLVKDSLTPNLESQHKDGKDEMTRLVDAVTKCNTDASTKLNETKAASDTVNAARTNHTTCRSEGETKSAEHQEACDDLKSFKEGINAPATKPSTESDEEWKSYITTMTDYWKNKDELFESKVTACGDAKKLAEEHAAKCNAAQSQFELDFCNWRTELLDVCSTLDSAYETAVKNHDDRKAAIEALIPQWKSELVAIKKIDCFLDTWLDTTGKSHSEKLDHCKGLNPDTSSMDITFAAVPAKDGCDTSAVSTYPGSGGFAAKEYANVKGTVAVTSCPAAPTPAPAGNATLTQVTPKK
eukprot:gnl/TRDRNA2_/TRDRNA2_133891_c1_seq1.p1 gnl/TRDRNA2_/TRDRNA2_133891_c1~~gnl/TRDRNA2_/TRDRNA2_133891_c1_seq1.p1  ORF type:complete len:398 (+),score=102.44 gnl/TRDRNA2_/TRDRNA2_133891_c1_seq1:64-1257(+)